MNPQHSALKPTPLSRSIESWVPEGRDPSFYQGFLMAMHIQEAIEALVLPEYRLAALQDMERRCTELAKPPHTET